jgi:phosphate transport system substrate-binding protein
MLKPLLAAALALTLVGCGDKAAEGTTSDGKGGAPATATADLKGSVNIDGSTTVYPIAQIMGEDFGGANSGVKVSVNKAGTGSGFQKFMRGEIDIATASRPIEDKEIEEAKKAGIEYVEVPIAFDGVTVIVNPANSYAVDWTPELLKKAWMDGSTVSKWSDLNPQWPGEAIQFHGPTENHGTYEYFTEAVNGKKNSIRRGYQPDQEYTSIVQAVAGEKNAIGFVGFNYYEENKDKVKAAKIAGIEPSADSILSGSYKLSRPLFLYVSKKAYARPEVKAFLDYALSDEGLAAVEEAKYVKLPAEMYGKIREHTTAGTAGSGWLEFGEAANKS